MTTSTDKQVGVTMWTSADGLCAACAARPGLRPVGQGQKKILFNLGTLITRQCRPGHLVSAFTSVRKQVEN